MELKNADLFGVPPTTWISRLVCKIVGAKTFHWGWILGIDDDGYICSESINKGTAVTRFAYPKAYIYRIKDLPEVSTDTLLSIHSWQGECLYDMAINWLTGLWFILKHYLKIVIKIIPNHKYNCQEWTVYMAAMLGYKIIPDDEQPYCVNLEKSDKLEYVGEYIDRIIP
jgi:hypothetical protein